MQELVTIILASGRTALDLALHLLLPVMVIMLALMKALEDRGILAWTARLLSPLLRIFGIPGSGAFARLQLLLISFAGPIATLSIPASGDFLGFRAKRKSFLACCLPKAILLPEKKPLRRLPGWVFRLTFRQERFSVVFAGRFA